MSKGMRSAFSPPSLLAPGSIGPNKEKKRDLISDWSRSIVYGSHNLGEIQIRQSFPVPTTPSVLVSCLSCNSTSCQSRGWPSDVRSGPKLANNRVGVIVNQHAERERKRERNSEILDDELIASLVEKWKQKKNREPKWSLWWRCWWWWHEFFDICVRLCLHVSPLSFVFAWWTTWSRRFPNFLENISAKKLL